MMRIFLSLMFIFFATFGVERLNESYNGGFQKNRIVSSSFREQITESPRSSDFPDLDKPFHYVGKGRQAYVFASEDNQYVIKFFKVRSIALESWTKYLPASFLDKSRARKKERYDELCSAYRLAFTELPQETAVLFIHLDHTEPLNKTVTLTDNLGISYTVDLDETQFVIQKRVTVLIDVLQELLSSRQEEAALCLMGKVVQTLKDLGKNGIACPDPNFLNNIGIFDGEIIILDPGRLVKDEQMKNPGRCRAFIKSYMYEWEQWLESHYPAMTKEFRQLI